MVNDEKRREVAKRLREISYKPGWSLGDWWLRVHEAVVGSEHCLCPQEDVAVISDLIDRPTCKIILARELRTAYGKPITEINGYILSCGHQAVGFAKPRYCPECGMEVGE